MHCSVWDPACMHTCIHGTNAHVYMTTYIDVVNGMAGNFRVLGCTVCWLTHAVKCSNYKWAVCHNTLPLQLVVGVKGLLTVHTYSDCQQLPHSPGEPLKFKVERCCMNSQALQQSESENRRSHRLGLLGLVMFNGIIHLTCVLSMYNVQWCTTKMYKNVVAID